MCHQIQDNFGCDEAGQIEGTLVFVYLIKAFVSLQLDFMLIFWDSFHYLHCMT